MSEENFEIIGKVKKIFHNENNHVVVVQKNDGSGEQNVSHYGKCPEDLKEQQVYKFTGKIKGKYWNYSKYESVTNAQTIPQPTIIDNRQDLITLGQAVNLAQKHVIGLHKVEEQFNKQLFKDLSKQYYEMIKELQKEILNNGN